MALELSGERPLAASVNPFRTVLSWIAGQRKQRAQRLALAELLEFDSHRLADLGINRADLFEAMNGAGQPGRILANRRAARASRNPRV